MLKLTDHQQKRLGEIAVLCRSGWRMDIWDDTVYPLIEFIYKESLSDAQVLVDAVEGIMWINECKCGEAWTGRGMHEANSLCGELDEVKEALDKYLEET